MQDIPSKLDGNETRFQNIVCRTSPSPAKIKDRAKPFVVKLQSYHTFRFWTQHCAFRIIIQFNMGSFSMVNHTTGLIGENVMHAPYLTILFIPLLH